jgi:hypothetical protein
LHMIIESGFFVSGKDVNRKVTTLLEKGRLSSSYS